MTTTTDQTDARLLELIQKGIPITSRPFDEIAGTLAIPPEEAISRISRLRAESVIRQIGAIFNSAALGYSGALVAFDVEDEELEAVAAAVSSHSGVSHCYSRDASHNLWFTVTVGPGRGLGDEIRPMTQLPGVNSYLLLPATRVFKIGVFFSMNGDQSAPTAKQPQRTEDSEAARSRHAASDGLKRLPPDAHDRAAIVALQRDFPLVVRPFAQLAAEAGMTEEELLRRADNFLRSGSMRRFAAVLRHQQAGYTANAMVCWRVEEDRIDEVGSRLAADPSVSHCYQRPTFDAWPYSVYTMIHGRSDAELGTVISRLVASAAGVDHRVLHSVKEYKKTRVTYFQDDQ